MKNTSMIAIGAVLMTAITGCTRMTQEGGSAVQTPLRPPIIHRVAGRLAYRERIALPPSVRVEVVVTDISEGANQELVLARSVRTVENASPPIPFSLDVSHDRLSKGPLFGLRAFIYDMDGVPLFRSGTPFLVDMDRAALDTGTITLVSTGGEGVGSAGVANIHGARWVVERIGAQRATVRPAPAVTFGLDNTVSGTGGCNVFSSTYALDGEKLTVAPIAGTLRACEPGLMEQERRFMAQLGRVVSLRIGEAGRLVLRTGDGTELIARRERPEG